MSFLTAEKQKLFIEELKNLRKQLENAKPKSTLKELERFENQQTLDELEACITNSKPEELNENLTKLLATRWERIRNTSLCYTQQPYNLVNLLCLNLAKEISPPITTEDEIDDLEPHKGPYFLLMPSLQSYRDIYLQNIHSLGLHEFILSDDGTRYIPISKCFHDAYVSDAGQFRHIAAIGDDEIYPELLTSERERLAKHSKEGYKYYRAVSALNNLRLVGEEIGPMLAQLAQSLRRGGAHSRGSEYNAGSAANLGILNFSKFWEALPDRQKRAIYKKTPELEEILGRLFRPDDANYKEVIFCVELIAEALDGIVYKYNSQTSVKKWYAEALKQELDFEKAGQSSKGLTLLPNEIAPKHILQEVYKLDLTKQKLFFKEKEYNDALIYALAEAPDAIVDFELNSEDKKRAISAKFKPNNDSALIRAAKVGSIPALKSLLSLGADHKNHDNKGRDALNWAIANGHVEAVDYLTTYLLEHNASLDAKDPKGNTPLQLAVYNGNKEIVELLLSKASNLTLRNNAGENALEIAIKRHPELVAPILMKIAGLPAKDQAQCLASVPGGPYKNVFFYAASPLRSKFFNSLILATIKQQPNIKANDPLFTTPNEYGNTPLILAAKLGALTGIEKMLDLGIDSNSSNKGDTALAWAVYNGKRDVVELLLRKSADITIRNIAKTNALEIAIYHNPKLVEPLLIKLLSLPIDKQAECLKRLKGGPYPNALFYAATLKPAIFEAVLAAKLKEMPAPTSNDQLLAATDNNRHTLGILAAKIGSKNGIAKLLDLGLEISASDKSNNNSLIWAVVGGHVDTIVYLLERGANIDSKGYKGNTALTYAVYNGKKEVVELLLKNSADLSTRNEHGDSALDFALARHPELVDMILMKLAELPLEKQAACLSKIKGGPYPNVLFYAAVRGNVEVLNYLLQLNVKLDSTMQDGDSALMLAVSLGKKESVDFLLKNSAVLNIRNAKGENALDIAIALHPELIEPILVKLASLSIEKQAECLHKVPGGPYPNVLFYAATKNSDLWSKVLNSFNDKILDAEMANVQEHVHKIGLQYHKIKAKSSNNLESQTAVKAAETLLASSTTGLLNVYQSKDENKAQKKVEFKETCEKSITTARPNLANHGGFGQLLTAFLLALMRFSSSKEGLSVKTKFTQLLDELQEDLRNPGRLEP